MQRTQIYLTESEQAGLQRLAQARGATLSAVIREAVDQYLAGNQESDWRQQRLAAYGAWADRPEPESLRQEERFGDWRDAA